MMKFPLLFLTTLLPVADATTIKTDQKLLNPEDVKKIVESSKANIPRLTQDYNPCASAQEAIYTDPAMAPAYFPSFVYTFLWKDPSFDMAGYFDALNFDTKCVELGGEVWQRDVKLNCGEGDTTWTAFKWCKPTVCDEMAYTMEKDYTVARLGQLIECDMELVDDTTPSIECIMGITEVYGTALEEFAPEVALEEDGIKAIEELGACTQSGSNGYDIEVCDMSTLEDTYELITNLCETDNDAKIVPFDMTLSVGFYQRTLKRYPVCVPNACSMKDTFLYYGMLTEEAYEDFGVDIDFKLSSPSSCTCCEEMRSEMNTILSEILDLVKTPPEPVCNDKKGMFKFGPDQKRVDWCAFIRRGKNDVQKKNRCNRPDDDGDTGLHTFCCEACKDVL